MGKRKRWDWILDAEVNSEASNPRSDEIGVR